MKLKYSFYIQTNKVGSKVEDVLELDVEDKATEEEIEKFAEEVWKEWIWNYLEGGFYKAD